MNPVLSQRALNRATLSRQFLLQRTPAPAADVIEALVGLQAQTTHSWYTALWTRIEDFDPLVVAAAFEDRRVVRMALMRGTIHLVTARDCLWLRPLVQPMIERMTRSSFGRHYKDLDLDAVRAAGREFLAEEPLTFAALGRRLAEQWPDRDAAALAQVLRGWEPLVQVPPRGVWGRSGQAAHTTVEHWLGVGVVADPSPEELVRRYLAAFGPASVKDVQAWCSLTRLGEVVDKLRPELVVFCDENGRELFDLPDAPRPDPDTPAPVRFMYDFENLFLSYDDRSRMHTVAPPAGIFTEHGPLPGTILVDGFTAAAWTIVNERKTATLKVQAFATLSPTAKAAIAEEGQSLLRFAAPGSTPQDIQFTKLW